jgi:integrase
MACISKRRNRWVVDYRDALGIRRWISCRTKKQADEELAKSISDSRQGALRPDLDPEITVEAYADRWLEQIAGSLAPKTLASYRDLLRLHIKPTLKAMKVRRVHRGMIKTLLAEKRRPVTQPDGTQKPGLGKNSVRLIRATLSVMLADAVDDGLLRANPARDLGGRDRRKRADSLSRAERQQKICPLAHEQLATFLDAAFDRISLAERLSAQQDSSRGLQPSSERIIRATQRDAVLFLTLADTGLRPGEALGLKWEDVDSATRLLHVERAISLRELKPTKTGESRTVDLTLRLADALSRWQAMCEADTLAAGGGDVTPWIFPSEACTPLEAAAVYKRFRSLLSKAKLPRFRLYDLRHTFATHLLALGAPITYVAAQLGHAKPTTTLAHYAHWLPRGDKTWIDHLAEARGSKTVARDGGNLPEPSTRSVESTNSPVAQLVERLTVNQEVAGSSPARGANYHKDFRPFHHARPPLVPLSGSSDSPARGSFAPGFRSSALTHRLPWLGIQRA